MRLNIVKSGNKTFLYIIKSTYINKVDSTKIVLNLGTYDSLLESLNGQDPIEYGRELARKMTNEEKAGKEIATIKLDNTKETCEGERKSYNGGYLFLQKIYYSLEIDTTLKEIGKKYEYKYDLNAILSNLIYSRILFPGSKLATFHVANNYLEQPNFKLHQIYRGLEVLAKETKIIQSELYKSSLKEVDRATGILYYDCTNLFFEIEKANGNKQYGVSKEHKPNPIIQIGLMTDNNGIPLGFDITPGNTNEQTTLIPLEERIIKEYNIKKLVICTDAGLSSLENRKYNSTYNRSFIITQPIKKLKKHLKEWCLETTGWRKEGSKEIYDISKIDEEKEYDSSFYKVRWIKENDFEQRLIVTYSIKYRDYSSNIRKTQIQRANELLAKNPSITKTKRSTDYKRLIASTNVTSDGEIAENDLYYLDTDKINDESQYDGYYAVCTDLDDKVKDIIEVNKRRWQIEECFRIMKHDFEARPVYLKRDDRIQAHVLTCFISLLILKIVEKKLDYKYTTSNIIKTLSEMTFYEESGFGYRPSYIRTELTNSLHDKFGFATHFEFNTYKKMKEIYKLTKSKPKK